MTTTTKITKKDNLTNLLAMLNDSRIFALAEEYDLEALIAYCENEISLLNKRAERARETAATKKEKDELCEVVESLLTREYQTRDEITEKIQGEDVTVAKVGNRLSKLVALGVAEKEEIQVAGKKHKVVAYRLAIVAEADE